MNITSTTDALTEAAYRIINKAVRKQVLYIIDQGIDNADYTVFIERAQPVDMWNTMAVESMVGLLSDGGYGSRVIAWFARHGITV